MFDNAENCLAGIAKIIDQKQLAFEFSHAGDVLGNIQIPLDSTGSLTIRAGGHDCQRLTVDTTEKVAGAHTSSGKAKQGIKFPSALSNACHETLAKFNIGVPIVMGVGGVSHISVYLLGKTSTPKGGTETDTAFKLLLQNAILAQHEAEEKLQSCLSCDFKPIKRTGR